MKNNCRKIIVLALAVATLAAFRPAPARADYWGASMASQLWKQTTEQMVKSIQDTLLANAKMMAVRVIQARVLSLLQTNSGSSASGLSGIIISNWQSFIYNTAGTYSMQITNDFFRGLEAGSTSAIKQYVLTPAQNAANENIFSMMPDIQNYCPGGDPTKAFDSGTSNQWKCWNASAQPQNDLASTYLRAMSLKQAAYEMKAESQKAEGLAGQGYASKKTEAPSGSSGSSDTTKWGKYGEGRYGSEGDEEESIGVAGSTLAYMANMGQSMAMRLIEQAKSIPEVAVNMVTSTLTQMVNQGINQAFSKIQ
jgi:hypothetical protein